MNRSRGRRMALHRLAAAALLVPLACGCATFHVYPAEDRNLPVPDERFSAIVTNPELSREAAILAYSGIYDLDHPGAHPVRITLQPLEVRKASGKFFAFALYGLHVAERWWLFDFLSRSRNQEEKLGEALRAKISN